MTAQRPSRKRAGRKPEMKRPERRNIYATVEDFTYAAILGGGNISKGFRALVDAHRKGKK
jgi:hypothetical protein